MSLVLIDTSYTSFYRFFATLRWFSLNQPEFYKEKKNDNTYDWSENKIFIEKYEKMYLESIIKLIGNKIYKNCKMIFCMDSPKENIWRMKLSQSYKSDRCDLSIKNNFKPTFNQTYNKIIPNLLINNPDKIFKLRINELEADDIIAVICRYYEKINPHLNIYLISGDQDFLQLGRPNLHILDYKKNKKPIILSIDEANNALRLKILNGDCSDNIPSIFPKDKKILSLKKKKELIEDNEKLIKYLDENPDIKKKYELNQKLICFDFIPSKFKNNIIKEFIKLKLTH
jgi:5'-3' exonuclease